MPDQGKAVAAHVAGHGLHHSQTGGCGQGCVKGVSAFFDHIQACLGSQGLGGADHSPAAVDKTAAGRIAVLERVKMKIHEISSLS